MYRGQRPGSVVDYVITAGLYRHWLGHGMRDEAKDTGRSQDTDARVSTRITGKSRDQMCVSEKSFWNSV